MIYHMVHLNMYKIFIHTLRHFWKAKQIIFLVSTFEKIAIKMTFFKTVSLLVVFRNFAISIYNFFLSTKKISNKLAMF